MKVAIIHDYLNQYGGAERVLESLLTIFPDAHIYTLLYNAKRTLGRFDDHIYHTSFLDFGVVRNYHRPFIPFMPLAAETMAVDNDYDLIISDTAGYAKGIRHGKGGHRQFHLSYVYTPLRYAWELDNYFKNPVFKTFFRPAFNYLKNWDFQAAQKPDKLVAVSRFIAGKIKDYYNRESQVLYPPMDNKKFYHDPNYQLPITNYYLAVGRLLHYKRFDLIIRAFKELKLPLKIVGTGPEEKNLKSQISNLKNIELIPFVSDEDLRKLYQGAKALIFPQVEDFGLVAAEAQACGTPVIAIKAGGALEIVEDGVTGIFFGKQSVSDLVAAVKKLELMKFDRKRVSQVSQRFSLENFRRGILACIPEKILRGRS